MKSIVLRFSSSIFLVSALLMAGGCVKDNGQVPRPPEEEKPTEPISPKPEPKEVHVVSTDYSIGGDQYDRDTLFVHFDGKITYTTIPHYDWITYTDYYYPDERIILDDTTLAYLVMVFDEETYINDTSKATFYDTRTGDIVFRKQYPPNRRSFITTPDGKYGIIQCNSSETGSRYGSGKVLIYVYDMPDLLSHIRFDGPVSSL